MSKPRTTEVLTISLPPAMARELEKAQKAEHRTRSELVRQALRDYLRARALPVYTPTRAELRSLARGRAEIRRGEYVTLDELRAYLATHPSKVRAEGHRPRSAARPRATARRA